MLLYPFGWLQADRRPKRSYAEAEYLAEGKHAETKLNQVVQQMNHTPKGEMLPIQVTWLAGSGIVGENDYRPPFGFQVVHIRLYSGCRHQLQSTSRLEATCRSFTAKSRISQYWLPVDYKSTGKSTTDQKSGRTRSFQQSSRMKVIMMEPDLAGLYAFSADAVSRCHQHESSQAVASMAYKGIQFQGSQEFKASAELTQST